MILMRDLTYLEFNPNSQIWKEAVWGSVPRRRKTERTLPCLYVFGMVGYALSVISRTVIVVIKIFETLAYICSSRKPAYYGWSLLKDFGYLLVVPIGVICPPLGYYLDEKIHGAETCCRKPVFPNQPGQLEFEYEQNEIMRILNGHRVIVRRRNAFGQEGIALVVSTPQELAARSLRAHQAFALAHGLPPPPPPPPPGELYGYLAEAFREEIALRQERALAAPTPPFISTAFTSAYEQIISVFQKQGRTDEVEDFSMLMGETFMWVSKVAVLILAQRGELGSFARFLSQHHVAPMLLEAATEIESSVANAGALDMEATILLITSNEAASGFALECRKFGGRVVTEYRLSIGALVSEVVLQA